MPTASGSKDAFAVSSTVGGYFNSAYTFLLQLIVLQAWAIIINVGLLLFYRKESHSYRSVVVSIGIWNSKSSPFDVLKLAGTYWVKFRHSRALLLLVLLFLAFAVLIINYALPILVASHIYLGHAAPVAPYSIYAPSIEVSYGARYIKAIALNTPSALRAAGSAQVANQDILAKASVDEPEIVRYTDEGEPVIRMNYRYNMTGADFGLQHYPDLALHVEGSCTTEYGWHANTTESSGITTDEYLLFNDPSRVQAVSLDDGYMPLAYFSLGGVDGPNITWAAIVSSVGRASFTTSTDPWYQTVAVIENGNFSNGGGPSSPRYAVRAARPALSCWQTDMYSYRGYNSSIVELNSNALPGLDMSPGLQGVLVRNLGVPAIVLWGGLLGGSTLQSATSATPLGAFDANSSTVYDDLKRLVLVAYIGSVNALINTVLYPTEVNSVPNMVLDLDGVILPGVDEFVIFSSEVTTLSVPAIVVIPVIFLVLFVINYCMINLPSPWYRIQALQATVLFTSLHQLGADNPGAVWRREGGTGYSGKGDTEPSAVKPHYDRRTRIVNWEPVRSEGSITTSSPIDIKRKVVEEIVEGPSTPSEEMK
jgi:hypothetical protein